MSLNAQPNAERAKFQAMAATLHARAATLRADGHDADAALIEDAAVMIDCAQAGLSVFAPHPLTGLRLAAEVIAQ
ncbi:hypothetical protein [Denitromonas halophila]|uniref:Uncharacterized protein n=1 Tax=Denitromonas halophila TaxID=1629404 RepID=A0A557QXB3_9RHOO|nr:hypothetical protein [Denitromonas halophila]TVO57560.1 hypothetical protein FHP91_07740 [Denitromonas halophila]